MSSGTVAFSETLSWDRPGLMADCLVGELGLIESEWQPIKRVVRLKSVAHAEQFLNINLRFLENGVLA
jgi:hypothetical protein